MNKSYKSFSLTMLQLPAPSSNLTKAEYKEAYGIDLNEVDIPSFKLVVYGNDKYAIDQVKAIEGGYEIYFNGRILSITDIVQTSDVVYGVENAKPIYYHGIQLSNITDLSLTFATILNNSDSLIDNISKLLSWITSIENEVFVPLTGTVKISGAWYSAIAIRKSANNSISLFYQTDTGRDVVDNVDLSTYFTSVIDRMNKIN